MVYYCALGYTALAITYFMVYSYLQLHYEPNSLPLCYRSRV